MLTDKAVYGIVEEINPYTGISMSIPKGGRGHLAPYEQAMCRVPEPLKEAVQKLVNDYRALAMNKEWEKGDRLAEALLNFNFSIEEEPDKPDKAVDADESTTQLQMLEMMIYKWEAEAKKASPTSRDWVQLRRFLANFREWKQIVDGDLEEMPTDKASSHVLSSVN